MLKTVSINYKVYENKIDIIYNRHTANTQTLDYSFINQIIKADISRTLEIENDIHIWYDDNGRIDKPENPIFNLYDGEGKLIYPNLAGDLYFTSFDENGETIGLTEEQVKIVENIFPQFVGFSKDIPIPSPRIIPFDSFEDMEKFFK